MIELIRKKTNKTDFVWETVMSENFRPLLFAGDINVYSVARTFHETYGIKVRAYGKYPVFPCIHILYILPYTKRIHIFLIPNLFKLYFRKLLYIEAFSIQ